MDETTNGDPRIDAVIRFFHGPGSGTLGTALAEVWDNNRIWIGNDNWAFDASALLAAVDAVQPPTGADLLSALREAREFIDATLGEFPTRSSKWVYAHDDAMILLARIDAALKKAG